MAENEKSRADDLFEILKEFDDTEPSAPEKAEEDTLCPESDAPKAQASENESYYNELLDILSAGNSSTEPESPDASEPQDEEEEALPTSLFSHLTDEGAEEKADTEVESNPHFTDHFSSGDDITVEPIAEEEEEDDEEEEEKESSFSVAGRILNKLSIIPKAIIYIVLVAVLSAYLSYYIIAIGNDVFALVTDSREVTITIEEGATHESVGELLESEGVIEFGWVYELYMKYRGDGDSSNEYIIGEHTLNLDYNYSQIITALTNSSKKREVVRITVPEGYTADQIIELLLSKGIGTKEGYVEALNNYPYKWEFVKRLDEMGYPEARKYRLEGYLYPDTYDFYTDEDEVYVINKMLSAFNTKFWADYVRKNSEGVSWEDMVTEKYGMTFDDIVTLASLAQSEGKTADDFYAISYVFHNRMRSSSSDMKYLQSDATLQYILPERIQDPVLLKQELDTNESPYNTYKHQGLTPGAISSPCLDALYAAVFPSAPLDEDEDKIDAYYFVSNDAGKTYYARTLDGHEKNKRQVEKDNEAIEAGTYEG